MNSFSKSNDGSHGFWERSENQGFSESSEYQVIAVSKILRNNNTVFKKTVALVRI